MIEDLVSVVMPTYNCGKYIAETIASVLEQSYSNFEIIIVDDCSVDDTEDVVKSFEDKRINYIKLEKNSGAAVARNKAMELARGQYIAFCDSDDLWYRDKLEKQISFMRTNNYLFTCTAYEQVDEFGQSLNKILIPLKKCNYNRLLLDCPVGNSTVMYDALAMGKFTVPDIRKRNDDALWLKMLKKEEYIYGLTDVLMKYRIRNNSISSNKWQVVKYHWVLYRNIEHLSYLRSIFHIVYWILIKALRIK